MTTSIRPRRIAQHNAPEFIRNCADFDASNLSGRAKPSGVWAGEDCGDLYGQSLIDFRVDASVIRYVVYSYSTPIAWRTLSGRWHIVTERFTPTTSSKHQSRLYLVGASHAAGVVLAARRPSIWRVDCSTCDVKGVTNVEYDNRAKAEAAAHRHRRNG